MSGVATATRAMVEACKGSKTRVLDTRKTMPGLRVLDKTAVLHGGGVNHRHGLHDMVMIKDNHISAAGSIETAITRVHSYLASKGLVGKIQVEVETRTLDEVQRVVAMCPALNEDASSDKPRVHRVMLVLPSLGLG